MTTVTNSYNVTYTMPTITRKEYMADSKNLSTAYYTQFDCPALRNAIRQSINMNAVINSNDKYLNDIPLHLWDAIRLPLETLKTLTVANGHDIVWENHKMTLVYSKADVVCIAKAVARVMASESTTTN